MNEKLKDIFTNIYDTNLWKSEESVSGTGSEIKMTKHLINGLNNIIRRYDILSLFDAPCGDFNWMKEVNLDGLYYIGGDIVEPIINRNKETYPLYDFRVCDITTDQLPKVDLIFTRDCLVHLNYEKINKFIENIKKSDCKYLLTTSFENKNNVDIVDGDWRPINLRRHPFNLINPIDVIDEKCTENYPLYSDKVMLLYKISDL